MDNTINEILYVLDKMKESIENNTVNQKDIEDIEKIKKYIYDINNKKQQSDFKE